MCEELYPIPTFYGYFLDKKGNVFSFKKGVLRLLKARKGHFGYLHVSPSINGKMTTKRVHRLMAMTFFNFKEDLVINHINNRTDDNRLENLELVTSSQNLKHSYNTKQRKGPRGEASVRSKLTWEQVKFIRVNKHKILLKDLAIMFNVHPATVGDVVHKRGWNHED